MFALRIENQDLRKKLNAIEENKKFKQTRKLLNKVKAKVKQKINVIKEKSRAKFEAHILQQNK